MTSTLYEALFRIGTLRDEVRALSCEIAERDQSRFLVHLDSLEAAAARLLDDAEQSRRSSSH